MEFDAVIRGRFKLVRIEVLDDSFLPASSNRLLSRLTTSEDLYVDHVMLLLARLWVVIDSTVKDQITWDHFFKLQIDRQSVILVSLIPPIKFKTKVLSEIVDNLAHESTAI